MGEVAEELAGDESGRVLLLHAADELRDGVPLAARDEDTVPVRGDAEQRLLSVVVLVGAIEVGRVPAFAALRPLSRDSATQVTVQGTATETQTNAAYTIRRAYNTFQAWETARQGDLVAEDRREIGVAYNDGPFNLTSGIEIRGSTESQTRNCVKR